MPDVEQTLLERGEWIAVGILLVLSAVHLAEDIAVLPLIGGTVYLLVRVKMYRRRAVRLATHTDELRREVDAARRRVDELSQGLAEQIDRQIEEWSLTRSEEEVARLLLKGLGHREIARLRGTCEKTARQQAAAVYAKAGVDGRAELSALFLEDLLVTGEYSRTTPSSRPTDAGDPRRR